MPPNGYTTVTISDPLAEKITRIMALHDRSSYADAMNYAVDTTLDAEDEITGSELAQMLAERVEELE